MLLGIATDYKDIILDTFRSVFILNSMECIVAEIVKIGMYRIEDHRKVWKELCILRGNKAIVDIPVFDKLARV